ncbi:MAG: type IV toxin-antitoxin system AbiEi family antitoxin domain-containing protein [Anaerolineaceae bacterium]|jgi:hypothetical protein
MLYTTSILKDMHSEYEKPHDRINRLVVNKKIFPVIRGLYVDDPNLNGKFLASVIYGPSYLSFEYALSYHGLIPELAVVFSSATFMKRRRKRYDTNFGLFTYRDIPRAAYPHCIQLIIEGKFSYQIASPEKAICDHLYTIVGIDSHKRLSSLLFEDLRIEESDFNNLNKSFLSFLAIKYQSVTLKTLHSWLRS